MAAAVIAQATAEPIGPPSVADRAWALVCEQLDAVAAGADPALLQHALLHALRAVAEHSYRAGLAARPSPSTPPREPPPEPKRAVVSVLLYPRQAPEGLANDAIDVELEDTRAARGIRIQYDFDRDGFVISAQPDPGESGPAAGEHDPRYRELAFVPAWHHDG